MAAISEEEKKKKLGNTGFSAPPAIDPGPMVGKTGDFPVNPGGTLIQKAGVAAAGAAPAGAPVAGESGGAVFGFYPQLADNKRTLYATGDKLRQGIVATGPREFAPALTPAALMSPMPAATRMTGATDPRSLTVQRANPTAEDGGAQPPVAFGNPSVQTEIQRGPGPTTVPVSAQQAPAQTVAATSVPGVNRIDRPGQPPLFTNLSADDAGNQALMERGFKPSAQNLAAADALEQRYGAQAAQSIALSQYNAEVAAAQQANQAGLAGTRLVDRRMQRDALLKQAADTQSRSKGLALVSAANAMESVDQRADEAGTRKALDGRKLDQQATEAGFKSRIDLQKSNAEQTRLGFESRAAEMDVATKGQLQALNAQILKETDPARLTVLQDKAQTITGRYQRPDAAARDVYGAIAGGVDAMGNKTDPIIYNKQTGEKAGAQSPPLPPGMKKQVGTANGKPVFEDASGKRFTGS